MPNDTDPDPDAVRHFADVSESEVPDTLIEKYHIGQARAWLDEAGCDLNAEQEQLVLTRLAAASIQTGPSKEVSDESLGSASTNYVALGMAGDGLMANANFIAATATCPGLLEWDKRTASIGAPPTKRRARGRRRID